MKKNEKGKVVLVLEKKEQEQRLFNIVEK